MPAQLTEAGRLARQYGLTLAGCKYRLEKRIPLDAPRKRGTAAEVADKRQAALARRRAEAAERERLRAERLAARWARMAERWERLKLRALERERAALERKRLRRLERLKRKNPLCRTA